MFWVLILHLQRDAKIENQNTYFSFLKAKERSADKVSVYEAIEHGPFLRSVDVLCVISDRAVD